MCRTVVDDPEDPSCFTVGTASHDPIYEAIKGAMPFLVSQPPKIDNLETINLDQRRFALTDVGSCSCAGPGVAKSRLETMIMQTMSRV
jgi:hypothetical protein